MNTLITSTKLAIAIAAVMTVAFLACAAEEPEDPQAPAAARAAAPAAPAEYPSDAQVPEAPSQVQQQPAQAAPARGPQLPEPAALPSASVAAASALSERQGPDQSMAMEEYEYMPMMPGPGEYYSYKWDGPIPSKFKEAPMLAQMVREGTIPPIEQRLLWRRTFRSFRPRMRSGSTAARGGSPRAGLAACITEDVGYACLVTRTAFNGCPRLASQ